MPSPSETRKRPFDFVPLPRDAGVDRRAPTGHDVYAGHSGRFRCRLEALSPFLIMDSRNRAGSERGNTGTFMTSGSNGDRNNGSFLIPGTSLKGMVRSVFEVLVPSCVAMGGKRVAQDFKACRTRRRLCPACRVFGFMGHGSGVHRGQVNIGEAQALEASPMPEMQLIPMFGPNPESDHYKETGSDGRQRPKGRKFYFHQAAVNTATENEEGRGPHVAPVEPGSTFAFTVTFENLSDAELQALVGALVLSDAAPLSGAPVAVRHKLGYGKPAGLGSVRIALVSAELEPPPGELYGRFDAAPTPVSDPEAWAQEQVGKLFTAPSPPVQKLIEILRYPAPDDVLYTYYPNGRDF